VSQLPSLHVDVIFLDEHIVGLVTDDALYVVHVHQLDTVPHAVDEQLFGALQLDQLYGATLHVPSLHVDVLLFELHDVLTHVLYVVHVQLWAVAEHHHCAEQL
jgi:hypothetical protein